MLTLICQGTRGIETQVVWSTSVVIVAASRDTPHLNEADCRVRAHRQPGLESLDVHGLNTVGTSRVFFVHFMNEVYNVSFRS